MDVYEHTLNQLLKKQTEPYKDDQYLFTLYFPTSHKTKLEINQNIKSSVLEFFKNDSRFSENKIFPYSIIEIVTQYIQSIDKPTKGIGVFMTLDFNEEKVIEDQTVFLTFPSKVDQEIFIGNTYSLDQLLHVMNTNSNALIFHIERENAEIWEMEDGKFECISREKNELLEFDITKRNKRPSAFSDRERYLGGGEYNMQRREEDENLNFLNQIFDKVADDEKRKKYDFIIVFYSSEFRGTAETFFYANISRLENPVLLFSDKTIKNSKSLELHSENLIDEYYINQQNEMIGKIEDEYMNYARGWDEVARNSQMRKIEVLFLNPNISKEGYIYENDFIYTDENDLKFSAQKEKMFHAKNIVPWLIKNVIASSGKVIFLKNLNLGENIGIVAKLRY